MTVDSLFLFLVATLVPGSLISCSVCFLMRHWAPRWRLLDQPGERKVHTRAVPLGGGIGIWLGAVGTFALGSLTLLATGNGTPAAPWIPEFARPHLAGLREQLSALWVLLGGATVLVVIGLIDDVRGLSWRIRIAAQFVVAAMCVYGQGWHLTAFVELPIVTGALSVLWIVMLVNSFNMLDNMDGLSGGVAAIACSILAAFLLLSPDPESHGPQLFVAGFLLVLVGALLGFLWHNRSPARIFMGDAGSYFVGFCIAIATMQATYAGYSSGTRHAILAPVCVLAVPLYELASVLWIRLRESQSPFVRDTNHFSHRLVELGMTQQQAVLTIYLATLTCGLGALLLNRVDMFGALLVVVIVACELALIAVLEIAASRK